MATARKGKQEVLVPREILADTNMYCFFFYVIKMFLEEVTKRQRVATAQAGWKIKYDRSENSPKRLAQGRTGEVFICRAPTDISEMIAPIRSCLQPASMAAVQTPLEKRE